MERQKLIHIHSQVEDKMPSASTINYGEIAVNYNSKTPFLSFKDNEDNVVKVSTDDWVNENFATLDDLDEVAFTTSESLISLNERVANVENSVGNVYDTDIEFTSSVPVTSNITPIDMAMSSFHSANRFELCKPAGVNVEYSTDGGSSWADYGLSDIQKIGLCSYKGYNIYGGAKGSSAAQSANDMVRITLTGTDMGVYTSPRKMLINFSTSYSKGCSLKVETATMGNPTSFSEYGVYPMGGWSAWNSIPLNMGTFGGGINQLSNNNVIRLTFSSTGFTGTATQPGFQVINVLLFGSTAWSTPSNFARTGHIYDWDSSGKAMFPAGITATTFNGYTINKSVPSDAVFTDTHHQAFLRSASTSTSTSNTTDTSNGIYLNLVENSAVRSSVQLLGKQNITVTSSTAGTVDITGPDLSGYATASALANKSDVGHTHAATNITSGQLNIARIPTGTTSGTVARGDHSHSGYVNQNAFSNVLVGSTNVSADTATDTLTLSAGTFMTLTPDATNDKVTFTVNTGTTSTTVARGDHNHDGTYLTSETYTGTVTSVKVQGTSGLTGSGTVTSSGTISIGHGVGSITPGPYGPTADVNGSNGATIVVPQIAVDAYGHVTGVTNRTYTSVDTSADTKNTAGSSNSTSKLYLVGAGSQSSTGVQTYSNSNVYMSGGTMYASSASTTNLTATTATILDSLRLKPSDENYGCTLYFGDGAFATIGETEDDDVLTIFASNGIKLGSENDININTLDGIVKINGIDTSTWKNTVQTNYDSGSTVYLAGTTATTSASTSNTGTLNSSNIFMSGNTLHGCDGYYQDSDERLKEFIGDIDVDLEKLSQLPKKYFRWVRDGEDGKLHIGTSAQGVRELYPELVSEEASGKLSVDYSKLSMIALKGIDKLYEEMNKMKSDLNLIKEKLGL